MQERAANGVRRATRMRYEERNRWASLPLNPGKRRNIMTEWSTIDLGKKMQESRLPKIASTAEWKSVRRSAGDPLRRLHYWWINHGTVLKVRKKHEPGIKTVRGYVKGRVTGSVHREEQH